MKKSIWKEPEKNSSTLSTKTKVNVGQVNHETVFVVLYSDAALITGPFRTPDGKSMYEFSISNIHGPKPIAAATMAFGRKWASPQATDILRELTIALVPTLPNDFKKRGAKFSRQQLLEGLKRTWPTPREVPTGEKVSRGNRERE